MDQTPSTDEESLGNACIKAAPRRLVSGRSLRSEMSQGTSLVAFTPLLPKPLLKSPGFDHSTPRSRLSAPGRSSK
jgi:hypothetical protein